MFGPGLSFFILCSTLGALVMLGWYYWKEVRNDDQSFQQFHLWIIKGLLFPIVIWTANNSGWLFGMSPAHPNAGYIQQLGLLDRIPALLSTLCPSIVTLGSLWMATTLLWLFALLYQQLEDPEPLKTPSLIAMLLGGPLAVLLLYWQGWQMAGLASLSIALPLIHFTVPLIKVEKRTPIYAPAVAKMKFGKYEDAEQEVIQQLEQVPEDYDGWMMLAELYATQFDQLGEAAQVVYQVCDQPEVTDVQIALALHKLADWQLSIAKDPDAAYKALTQIGARLPRSHFAKMAQQRINRLPTREDIQKKAFPRTVRLARVERDPDKPPSFVPPSYVNQETSKGLANECVEQLNRNPNNIDARERLAGIFADHFLKLDLAKEQIVLLIEMPDQPIEKLYEWFDLLATWECKHRNNPQSAMKLLKQFILKHPSTPYAFLAQKRLNLLKAEARYS